LKKRAGFWIRFLANFLDGLVLMVIYLPIAYLLFDISISDYFLGEEVNWGSTSLESIIGLCYFIILPMVLAGATLGKKATGIQIRKTDGSPLTWSTMLLRELLGKMVLAFISLGIIQIISAFMVGLREDRRSIHDLIAKTEVIYPKQVADSTVLQHEEILTDVKDITSNKSLVSLILGILSLISPIFMLSIYGVSTIEENMYYPYFIDPTMIKLLALTPVLMIILSIVSIVLYYRAKSDIVRTNAKGLGFAMGGFVCSVISIFISIFLFLLLIVTLPFMFY